MITLILNVCVIVIPPGSVAVMITLLLLLLSESEFCIRGVPLKVAVLSPLSISVNHEGVGNCVATILDIWLSSSNTVIVNTYSCSTVMFNRISFVNTGGSFASATFIIMSCSVTNLPSFAWIVIVYSVEWSFCSKFGDVLNNNSPLFESIVK